MVSSLSGSRLGRYEVNEELGHGSAASVYKAYDPKLKREVAIKVLVSSRGETGTSAGQFQHEAELIANLSHPNILPVHDVGENRGFSYIVTKYVAGGTLFARLGSQVRLDELMEIAFPLAHALDYAHQQGIVHRDIKPANVLLELDGTPLIADFGIARMLEAGKHLTRGNEIRGTLSYMSPEQVLGRPVDGRSDVYSLAVILYEMLVGQPALRATTIAETLLTIANETPRRPSEVDTTIVEVVDAALMKELSKDPDQRFQTAHEFVEALASGLGGKTGELPRPASPIQAAKTKGHAGGEPSGVGPEEVEGRAIRVFLVEDQLIVQEALRNLIEKGGEIEVIGVAESAEEALKGIESTRCDVVVMDIGLPGVSGIEATRQIKQQSPDIKVLMLSGHGEEYLRDAIVAGADGYITKTASGRKLRESIQEVYSGASAIDPTLMRAVLRGYAGDVSTGEDAPGLTGTERPGGMKPDAPK